MKAEHNKTETIISRRSFLKSAALASAGAIGFPYVAPASALGRDGKVAPSNRINMGFIGTGNQGTNDLRVFLGDERVQVLAVCDVNKESNGYWDGGVGGRGPAKEWVEAAYASQKASGTYKGCDAYADFREMLARKDIDAVEVATPDHWHALAAISVMKAGKDIYCQKPLALTIAEGRAIANAAHKYKRIFQTGSQQRSDKNFRIAAELVRNGRIGKLQTVRCGLPGGRPDYGHTGDHKKPEPVPEGFDYEMWLGPAPEAPYAPAPLFCQLSLDLRLFRRAGHGLGRASSGLRAVGHGHRAYRASRDTQCQRGVSTGRTLEYGHRVLF